MTTLIKSTILITSLFFANQTVFAHSNDNECHLSLNSDLSITPEHIRILEDDQTMVDIYKDNIVFIKGEQITLTAEQSKLISDYSQSIRQAVPKVTQIAIDAVGLAYEGLSAGLGDFVDMEESREKFEQLQQKISDKYQNGGGSYSVEKGEFNINLDDGEIDQLVEEMVEDMVPNIIGGLLSNLGQVIASGAEGDFEDFGDKIEREIEAKADVIEKQADAFCESMVRVDGLEQQIAASDPKFIYFDLLNVERHINSN